MTEEPLDVDRLRAFVRGELDDAERARIEELLDRRADARQVLGVLAREGGRATDRDPQVGALLGGRYRVRRRLGAGGMGVVYEAEHELLGRRVALKMLHPEHAERAEVRRRFENEARAVAALDHPNVVAAFDVGRTPDGAPFVVYELLAGVDLEARLASEGALAIDDALELARGIAAGLAAAHALGIVHRDLKPANVFVTDAGVPKILDFGVSKLARALQLGATAQGLSTRSGAFMGTPAYMAPEQLRDAASVDARADVYALGVVLFRMITGAMPHPHATLGELLAAHERPAPSPRARRADLPLALDALTQHCLAPDRDLRPADARAVHDALARLIESRTSPTRTSTRPPDDRRLVTALVCDRALDEGRVRDVGGRVLVGASSDLSAEPCVAIFGESGWSREHQEAALRVALDQPDGLCVVGAARHDRVHDRVEGDALETFSRASARGARGVLVSAELASAFPSVAFEELAPGLHRVRDASPKVSTPFVGREVERARISEVIELVVEERRPRIVRVEGPPGVGKSRLIDHVVDELGLGGRTGRARATPELEELTLLRAWIGDSTAPASDDPRLTADRSPDGESPVTRREARAGLHEPIVPRDDERAFDPTRDDPQLRADRLRLAALAALDARAKAGARVLVLEDAHEASRGLLEAIERLAQREGPIALVLASRVPLPLVGPSVEHLALRGLRRRATAELARALDRTLDEATIDTLHARTEGNPLFVEQLVRGPHGADVRAAEIDRDVPATIEAALQARLDALPLEERAALEGAAAIDGPFDAEDLRALGCVRPDEAIAGLRAAELVVREGDHHRIASSLVVATATRALSDDRRRALHAALATWRIARNAPAAVIARHLDEASDPAAAPWHARAAREAATRGEGGAVIRHGERALSLGRAEVALVLAEAYELAGRLDDEARVLEHAGTSAEVLARQAIVALRRGEAPRALELFERAERASAHGDAATRARVAGRHAVAALYAGRLDEARRRLDDAERRVWVHAPELRAEAAVWRAQLAAASGDLGERRNAYWAAVELYRERGDVRRRAQASVNLADVDNRLGAYEDAVRALQLALADCAALGLDHAAAYAQVNLAYALVRLGRCDEALAAIARARGTAARVGDRRLEDVCALYALRARLEMGHDVTSAALELARSLEGTSPPLAALAFACAARAALPGAAALELAERASEIVAELGSLEEDEAEVAVVHAAALDALGRTDAAREVRAIARAGVLAAARRIADPTWRDRYLRDVPAHRALMESA